MSESSIPRIQIDDDWKTQAQAEKQRLAQQVEKKSSAAPGIPAAGTRPQASSAAAATGSTKSQATLSTLVSTLAAQALLAMGVIADPRTGQRMQSLDAARHHIDMLGVLEDKTRGNLTADEETMLASTLYELRTRYIQACQAARMK